MDHTNSIHFNAVRHWYGGDQKKWDKTGGNVARVQKNNFINNQKHYDTKDVNCVPPIPGT
jgi:hypothetical protein